MAVELARPIIPSTNTGNRKGALAGRPNSPNLKLIDTGRSIASKIAFEASMQRAQLNQKYWDDILQKLRKAGGGGGGSRFDRIIVSMQLMNFLSNKTIQAMLRNFIGDMNESRSSHKNILDINSSSSVSIPQKIGNIILRGLSIMFLLSVRTNALFGRLHGTTHKISHFVSILSFQLNKLKELLEEDLKESIKKLDVKEKLKRIKTIAMDIFATIQSELVETIGELKSIIKRIFSLQLKQVLHE